MKFDDFFKLRDITLNITNGCNLKCSYCFEHDKNSKKMSVDMAEKIIDKCYNNYLQHKNENNFPFAVNFFGGEPFLNFGLMEHIMKYSKNKGYNIEFGVTTNMTILTDHMIDVIEEYELGLLVSIDGIKDIHDRNRCNSYDIVCRNIKKLIDRHLGYLIEARMTIMPDDVNCLLESIQSIVNMGIVNIAPVPVTDVKWSESNLSDLKNSLKMVWNWLFDIYNDNDNKKNISIKFIEDYLEKVLTFEAVKEQKKVCLAGGNLSCSIGVDGEIMPCHQRHTIKTNHDDLVMGNILSEEIKEIKFNDMTINSCLDCEKCIAKQVCQGGCPSENLTVNGNANLMNENQCKIFQTMVEVAIEFQDNLLNCSNIRSRRLNGISENLKIIKYLEDEVLTKNKTSKEYLNNLIKLYEIIIDKEIILLPLFNEAIKSKIKELININNEVKRIKNGN